MLHLLPIRFILHGLAAVTALILFMAFYMGWIGSTSGSQNVFMVIRWTSVIATGSIVLFHLAWRWIRPVQAWLFPYLGGRWSGTLHFLNNDKQDHRDVVLEIKHTLFGLKLLLESRESISWTLAVHAERHPDFDRFRMYYVYLNERKEGVAGGGHSYRGLAVLRFVLSTQPELHGNYFTETARSGTLQLKLERATQWWRLWR